MKQNPLISVIVPVYKVERFLPKCVESILNQTYRNLELILVDDGSPDGSGRLCDAYSVQDSRVRVLHKENGGLSDARNAGLDVAAGDYLSFVDGDDWIEPDTCAAMLAAAEKHGAVLVCAGRYDEDEATGTQTPGLCPREEELIPATEMVRRIFHWDTMDFSACDKLFARSLFDEIRFPVGMVCEDMPTIYRVVMLAERAALLPKPVYHYRHRASSITASAVSEKSFHLTRHAAEIYGDIAERFPALEPDARYLLVCSLWYVVEQVEHSPPAARRRFREETLSARRQLHGHLEFVRKSGFFSLKRRIKITLAIYGLYGTPMRISHLFRKPKKSYEKEH